jgi:hypothetical protein
MRTNLRIMAVLAAAACIAPAGAQDVYRCGDSYSQKPCPGGNAVQVEDARSASQMSQTGQAAQGDARLADAMEKSRLKEEAKPAQAYIPPAKPQTVTKAQGKPAPLGKPALFTAVSPAKAKTAAAKPGKAKKKPVAPA